MLTHKTNKCEFCNSENSLVTNNNSGQISCKSCNMVFNEKANEETSENQSSIKSKTQLATPSKKEDNPPKVNHKQSGNQNSLIQKYKERANVLANKLSLSNSILLTTHELLEKVAKEKKLKGRKLDPIIASVFYVACRQENEPLTPNEISSKLEIKEKKEVIKSLNHMKSIIIDHSDVTQTIIGHVKNFCNTIESNASNDKNINFNELSNVSVDICELICKKEIIAGRNPTTIAAASLLIASILLESKIGKKEIANAASTTENTINNAFNALMEYQQHIIPERLKDKMHLLKKN